VKKELEEYPNLKKELQKEEKVIPLHYVDEEEAKKIEEEIEKESEDTSKPEIPVDPFRFAGYNPTVIDFIRRCDTEDQAKEIIEFLEKKGDLTSEDSAKLYDQLQNEGLRSFGEKKGSGYYFHSED